MILINIVIGVCPCGVLLHGSDHVDIAGALFQSVGGITYVKPVDVNTNILYPDV